MKKIGARVRILGGMSEFIGKTGTIVGHEGRMCRVALDEPVRVPLVGEVGDDLWETGMLKTVRSHPMSKHDLDLDSLFFGSVPP